MAANVEGKFETQNIIYVKRTFTIFPFTRHATIITFQKSYLSVRSVQDGKLYLIENHKIYRYKVEVFVLHIGLAINDTNHHPAAFPDLEICQRNRNFHKNDLEKSALEKVINDIGNLSDYFTFMDYSNGLMVPGFARNIKWYTTREEVHWSHFITK